MNVLPFVHAVVVGSGPAGLAPLLAATHTDALSRLLQAGLVLVERSNKIGIGRLGRYLINSDSSAETFLSCVQDNPWPLLAAAASHPAAAAIASYGKGSVPLSMAGDFLEVVGTALHETVAREPRGEVLTAYEAVHTRRIPSGWLTRLRGLENGRVVDLPSRVVLLATGGHQPEARLQVESVAGKPLLPHYRSKLLQSDFAMTSEGLAEIGRRLRDLERPRIVIVGGSTSAVACTRLLLGGLNRDLPAGTITLMHRGPMKLFYSNGEAATTDGYTDFQPVDICPVTGFVFRFGGLRFESRELMMSLKQIGQRPAEPRVVLHRLADEAPGMTHAQSHQDSRRCLDKADIVIACLGYCPCALPILDEDGAPIPLLAEMPEGRLVGSQCGVLDAEGREIKNLFGLGLAAGFLPSRSMGGEPSHRGQVNGLWLWQNDVGALVAQRMLSSLDPAGEDGCLQDPVPPPSASNLFQHP